MSALFYLTNGAYKCRSLPEPRRITVIGMTRVFPFANNTSSTFARCCTLLPPVLLRTYALVTDEKQAIRPLMYHMISYFLYLTAQIATIICLDDKSQTDT